jgi:regulatory protein
MKNTANSLPTTESLQKKAEHYCSYQERCTWEVEIKLTSLGASEGQKKQIISKLKAENFLDEKRFCQSFVRGKIYNNSWGKTRIIMELKQRRLPEGFISAAINQIEHQQYKELLLQQAVRKFNSISAGNEYQRVQKTAAFLINKGFEPELVWQTLKKINDNPISENYDIL